MEGHQYASVMEFMRIEKGCRNIKFYSTFSSLLFKNDSNVNYFRYILKHNSHFKILTIKKYDSRVNNNNNNYSVIVFQFIFKNY